MTVTADTHAAASAGYGPALPGVADPILLDTLADFRRRLADIAVDGYVSMRSLRGAIQEHYLLLLKPRDVLTASNQDWHLEEIRRALPFLLRVCNRPRQHLRVEEEVRPVDVVRRIGPTALRHLASHSEHWEARTVAGLRPARLYAEVWEDELGIYENRFVVTLIDDLIKRAKDHSDETLDAQRRTRTALDWDQYAQDASDYQRHRMLEALIPGGLQTGLQSLTKQQLAFNSLQTRLLDIRRQLGQAQNSSFYRHLQRSERVGRPIRPTNILALDPLYHPLYELWQLLERKDVKPSEAITGALPEDLPGAYGAYCQVLLLVALQTAGFGPEGDETKMGGRFAGQSRFAIAGRFKRGFWTIQIECQPLINGSDRINLRFRRTLQKAFTYPNQVEPPEFHGIPAEMASWVSIGHDGITFLDYPSPSQFDDLAHLIRRLESPPESDWRKKNEWQRREKAWRMFVEKLRVEVEKPEELTVYLVPALLDLAANPGELEAWTSDLLNHLSAEAERVGAESMIALVPTSPAIESELVRPGVLRRLVNLGEAYVPGDAERWGSQQVGLLPISPTQISSLQRLVRLLNLWTVGRDLAQGRPLDACPVCGKSQIECASEFTRCRGCGAVWTTTQCPHADCKKVFPVLRPNVKPTPPTADDRRSYGNWLEKLEAVAGAMALTAFCEAEERLGTAIPICPACGRCPKESDHGQACPRCRELGASGGRA